MKKQNKIAICIACNYPTVPTYFMLSLFKMQQTFYEWAVKNKREDTLSLFIQGGYALDDMRNEVVDLAIKTDHTHLLLLDTDMDFPDDMIVKMIEDLEENEDQGVEVVTGLYTYKRPPFLPQVYLKYNEEDKKFSVSGAFPLDTLFKVDGAPAGCLMVKAEVFNRIESPYFKFVDKGEGKEIIEDKDGNITAEIPFGIGEDLYFCLKAKPLILCDPRLKCKHYKTSGYGIDEYIKFNKLGVKDNQIIATKKQLKEIDRKHSL